MPTTTQQSVQLVPYDFEHYVEKLIEYLQHNLPDTYQDFLEDNAARTLIDAIGYELSLLAYMINVNIKQVFLPTASTRKAMYLLGKLVDYELHNASPAVVTLTFTLSQAHTVDIIIQKGLKVEGSDGVTFETDRAVTLDVGETEVEVAATEGITVIELVGVSDGGQKQQYTASNPGLKSTLIVAVDDVSWDNFESSLAMTSSDKGYTSYYDEDYKIVIEFGNGDFGMIPPQGSRIQMTYRNGGGIQGNVGGGSLTEIVDEVSDNNNTVITNLSVTNEDTATGGSDAETLDQARLAIPLSVRSMDRLVSEEDFRAISSFFSSETYGNVYKSNSAIQSNTWIAHVISVYILGTDANGLPATPGSGLISAVQSWVDDRKLPSVVVEVQAATLATVDVTATVHYSENYRVNIVQANVNIALEAMFGYEERVIGEGLMLSDIYSTIAGVTGVEWVDIAIPTSNVSASSSEFLVEGTITISYTQVT